MNDERPIEKLLRRYAKKRRDEAGDPPSLHPATRRLLQGEVARQYPASSQEGERPATGFLALLVQRWAVTLGVLVVLAVTAVVLLPTFKSSRENEFLAQKNPSEDLAVRESLATASTPTPATTPAESQPDTLTLAEGARNQPALKPADGFNRDRAESIAVTNSVAAGSLSRFADAKSDSPRESEETKRAARSVSLGSAAPASRALTQAPVRSAGEPVSADSLSVAQASKESLDARADRYSETQQVAATPPASAAAPLGVSTTALDKSVLARGGGAEKDAERFYSQSFANVAPGELRAKAAKVKSETPAASVLAKFQVQQVGNQVRVIDADGSTYLGEMNQNFAADDSAGVGGKETAALAFEAAKKAATQVAPGSAAANQQATPDYFWRVEGTNRTLNQNVVFTWNFVATTNNPTTTQFNASASVFKQNAATLPSQFPVLLNNSVINGRAQLGPAQQIEVNAVPVK